MIVLAMAFSIAFIGFSQKALAGPVPIYAQERSQLNELSLNGTLMELKAGSSLP
jgi:hypothetical protein